MRRYLVPEKFREEYKGELSRLFWFRTNLFCVVTTLSFMAAGALMLFVYKGLLGVKGLPGTVAGGAIFPVVILVAGGRRLSLARQKGRAFFFSFFLILVALLTAAAHPEVIKYLGGTLVLLAFFAGVLLLPWSALEVIAIGLFTIANFTWIYRLAETYVSDAVFALNTALLSVAVFVAAVVKRNEEMLRRKEFSEHRELGERSARMAREMELANKIHKSLIPHSVKHELADIAVTYVPMMYMGGDYANFRFVGKDKLVFIVADVTGHGVSSALLVNRMDTEIERLLGEKTDPGEILKALDDFIEDDFGKMGYYLSAFAGLVDFSKKEVVYSNYGHPPQVLLRQRTGETAHLRSQTFLMGVDPGAGGLYTASLTVEKGDRLILFTDGILDAKSPSGEFYGSERLEAFVAANRSASVLDFNEKLLADVRAFQPGEQNDDIFLMTILVK